MQVDFGKEGGMVAEERERVTAWLADLDSNNLEVKEAALRGLGYAEDPRALPAVLECCGPKIDDATRMAAISALGRKGNYQAVEPLTAMLKDGKAPVLCQVAKSLETIQMPEAVPALLKAIKKEKRDRVLGTFLRAASHSQPSNTELRDICLKELKSASTQLTASVLVSLGRLDTHDKIVAALTPQLASKNQNTRGLAVWALGNHATDASTKALKKLQGDEKTPEVMKLLPPALRRSRGEVVEGYDSMFWTFLWDF
jgi:HEAT repeat protein